MKVASPIAKRPWWPPPVRCQRPSGPRARWARRRSTRRLATRRPRLVTQAGAPAAATARDPCSRRWAAVVASDGDVVGRSGFRSDRVGEVTSRVGVAAPVVLQGVAARRPADRESGEGRETARVGQSQWRAGKESQCRRQKRAVMVVPFPGLRCCPLRILDLDHRAAPRWPPRSVPRWTAAGG